MPCQRITLLLFIIIILYHLTDISEYFSYENSETTPMPQYLPKQHSRYVAESEPECGNHYGFYNITEPKKVGNKIINANFINADTTYDAYCSPYILNDKVTVCSVYDTSGNQLFYGFSNPRC